jgi:hypothetical protein
MTSPPPAGASTKSETVMSVRVKLIDGVAYAHMNDIALYLENVAKEVRADAGPLVVRHAAANAISAMSEKVRAAAHKAETER